MKIVSIQPTEPDDRACPDGMLLALATVEIDGIHYPGKLIRPPTGPVVCKIRRGRRLGEEGCRTLARLAYGEFLTKGGVES